MGDANDNHDAFCDATDNSYLIDDNESSTRSVYFDASASVSMCGSDTSDGGYFLYDPRKDEVRIEMSLESTYVSDALWLLHGFGFQRGKVV